MSLIKDAIEKGKDVFDDSLETYKKAETHEAMKEYIPYLVLWTVFVVGATYFVTKKMK